MWILTLILVFSSAGTMTKDIRTFPQKDDCEFAKLMLQRGFEEHSVPVEETFLCLKKPDPIVDFSEWNSGDFIIPLPNGQYQGSRKTF